MPTNFVPYRPIGCLIEMGIKLHTEMVGKSWQPLYASVTSWLTCSSPSGLSTIKLWDALVPLCNLQSCLQLQKLNWLMPFGCLATNIDLASTIPLLCFTDVPYEISDIDLRLLCAYLSLYSMVWYVPLAFTAHLVVNFGSDYVELLKPFLCLVELFSNKVIMLNES